MKPWRVIWKDSGYTEQEFQTKFFARIYARIMNRIHGELFEVVYDGEGDAAN